MSTPQWQHSSVNGMKRLCLCADDFSLNPAINAAVLALFECGALTATSCMVQSPSWRADAQSLLPWRGRVDLGVHLNFTEPFPSAMAMSLPQLMLRAQLRCLPQAKLRDSIGRQLEAFEDALGMPPDFIDGHQHVHVFPQIREVLLDEYERRYRTQRPYLRCISQLPADASTLKARVLAAMGGSVQETMLDARAIAHNTAFAGLYDFDASADLTALMRHWLTALPDGGLMMCHPALQAESGDVIGAARAQEFRWFSSEFWPQLLADLQVALVRLG